MLLFHGLLTVFLLAVFYTDFTRYLIPNWLIAIIIALYPAMLLMTPSIPEGFSIWYTLITFVAVFVIGLGLFALRLTGAGDVKLLAALSLWTGVEAIVAFIIFTALIGGCLAFTLLLGRPLAGMMVKSAHPEVLPRVLRYGEPVPYGLAIASAFLIVLWMGKIPGLPVPWVV